MLGGIVGGMLAPPLAVRAGGVTPSETGTMQRADERTAKLAFVIDPRHPGPVIDVGYTGFSYEKTSLGTGFFAASNQALVRLFRRLGAGLLRLGGNSVDRTSWRTSSALPAGTVGGADVDALATFLRATGWRALYGINLATNSPALAAEEAAYAARSLGRHLYAFEIGNEPDAYSFNHLRPQSFSYRDFLGQWNIFADAIRKAVPQARLTGPASAWHESSWTVPFAQDAGRRIILLTQHYYRANGLSPQSTLAMLLAGDPALPALLDPLRRAARAAGIEDGYRLTEANSFYDGGAPHISNTFGSALWAIDFLFTNVRLGSSGVNFHGGGDAPGYTPIADDGRKVIEIRPEYYGMLLFSMMGHGRLLNAAISPSSLALSAYAVASATGTRIMLVNKEPERAVDVVILPGNRITTARLTTLAAPALDSVSDVTLNGAPIRPDGSWVPGPSPPAAVRHGSVELRVAPASAVLVTVA